MVAAAMLFATAAVSASTCEDEFGPTEKKQRLSSAEVLPGGGLDEVGPLWPPRQTPYTACRRGALSVTGHVDGRPWDLEKLAGAARLNETGFHWVSFDKPAPRHELTLSRFCDGGWQVRRK